MHQTVQPQSPQSPSVAPAETKREIALKRWQSQKDYYSKRVGHYKNWHLWLQLYMGIIAVLVTILLGFSEVPKFIPSILSGTIAAAAVIENVNRYGENWRNFRTTLEFLKREKSLFDIGADVYVDLAPDDAAILFATRTEDILSAEWSGYFPSGHQSSQEKHKKAE
jgi:hypothetical protein